MTQKTLLAVLIAMIACTTANADNIISVNFIQSAGTDVMSIDADETYGIASLGTVVGNWENVTGASSGFKFDDGSNSTVSITTVRPINNQLYPAAYADTPLQTGIGASIAQDAVVTINNLNANFANGYYVINYLNGASSMNAASISDGTTTLFYKTLFTPGNFNGTLTETTDTTFDGTAPSVPIAQYAVFGSADNPLTADSVTFTLDSILNGAAGYGGFQIVAAPAPIPEPTSAVVLLTLGTGVLAWRRR